MNFVVVVVSVFVGLVACLEIGYRLGAKQVKSTPNIHEGFGAIEGAVFGLFGLLLSLSFFGAGSRLDARRQLIVDESNAIATAYMRVDVLPTSEQPETRRLFRDYLDVRLRISEAGEAAAPSDVRNSARLSQAIWSHAINANKAGVPGAPLLLLAVNQMMEIAGKKAIATQTHLPELVFALLIAVALLSGLIAGFGMARGQRNWLSVLVYASIVTMTLYVIIDLEYPRRGLVRIGVADRAMTDLRDSIQ